MMSSVRYDVLHRRSNTATTVKLALLGAALALTAAAHALEPAQDEELAYASGVQAYIYGYPMMDLYRTMWETSLDPGRDHDRTINEFFFFRRLITHKDDWIVTPNEDTIYHRAFLDLRAEPIVLVIPPMGNRKYWFPVGDMHHDFSANLSWDTVGTRGGNFAFCPPGWQGLLPEGVTRIDVATPIVWILGRYAVDGADVPAATALQDQTKLVPLSRWGQAEPAGRRPTRPLIRHSRAPTSGTRAVLHDFECGVAHDAARRQPGGPRHVPVAARNQHASVTAIRLGCALARDAART
jgi:hypothetical protein